MDKKRNKRTIFQCDFLSPVIFDEIESGLRNQFIKNPVSGQPWFLDPRSGKSSLKALRRKLNRFRDRDSSTRRAKNRVRSGELFRLTGRRCCCLFDNNTSSTELEEIVHWRALLTD